jgi:hypothetical protein
VPDDGLMAGSSFARDRSLRAKVAEQETAHLMQLSLGRVGFSEPWKGFRLTTRTLHVQYSALLGRMVGIEVHAASGW